MQIVVAGLSITSSWGNGHATTYRSLLRALAARGHRILFLERDMPWYADNRDLPRPSFCSLGLYSSLDDLMQRYAAEVARADLAIVGSYVPEGIAVGDWVLAQGRGVRAFYDIDTPVTLAALAEGRCEYLSRAQLPRYDLYLSFTGGPTLTHLEEEYGSPAARPLYCSFDPSAYFPEKTSHHWDLGYMGTYSPDRQPTLDRLLVEVAKRQRDQRFVVAGPLYPESLSWPENVLRIDHIAPQQHRSFYSAQRFTLNVTRADMIERGYSPSVRLFEAAACGVPILSDVWPGLEHFFEPGREIVFAEQGAEVEDALQRYSPAEARRIGARARRRVLQAHSAMHRAIELESYMEGLSSGASKPSRNASAALRVAP